MSKISWFKSIRTQMMFSYFVIVALILVVGIASFYHVRRVYSNGNQIYETNLMSVDYLISLNLNVRQIDQRLIYMLEGLGSTENSEYRRQVEMLQAENAGIMEQYEKLELSELEERRYKQCRLSMITFNKNVTSLLDMIESGRKDMAKSQYNQELMPVEACTYELLDAVADLATKKADESTAHNYETYQNIQLAIGITIALAILLAVAITLQVSGSITEKLTAIQLWAKRISEYNVSEDIKDLGEDEFGMTTRALNDSQFMIRDLVEKIMEESTLISDTGKEISGAIRKSKQRIENMNLKILDAEKSEDDSVDRIKGIMMESSLSPELLSKMKEVLALIENNSVNMDIFLGEFTEMATYLEQIAITSDHQNQMAESHKEQVGKFKVKGSN